MNLDELRSVQSKERATDSLQHLRESFYADVGEYIADLKAERARAAERADDPFDSPEVNRLTDEINTAEEVVEAIYERRVGKVVKRASLAAAGLPADEEGLTSEEQELFADLVERIEANKGTVLDVLAGEDSGTDAGGTDSGGAADTSPTTADADTKTVTDQGGTPPPEPGTGSTGGDDPDDAADAEPGRPEGDRSAGRLDERTTVRITRDVGEILGVDERAYDLSSEDVVTLPAENAEPLLEREAAEKLE